MTRWQRRRPVPGQAPDAGLTLTELVVSVVAGSLLLAAAVAIFVPAMQNAARDRQAGLNITAVNSLSQTLQRQVRDATYVKVTLVSNRARVMQLCTYATAASTTRTKVVWRFVPGTGVTSTTGSSGTPKLYGESQTFASVRFGFTDVEKTYDPETPIEFRIQTGDSAGGGTTGTPGTTLEFTAVPRSPQVVPPTGSACV